MLESPNGAVLYGVVLSITSASEKTTLSLQNILYVENGQLKLLNYKFGIILAVFNPVSSCPQFKRRVHEAFIFDCGSDCKSIRDGGAPGNVCRCLRTESVCVCVCSSVPWFCVCLQIATPPRQ